MSCKASFKCIAALYVLRVLHLRFPACIAVIVVYNQCLLVLHNS
jgi:hypothetical protein